MSEPARTTKLERRHGPSVVVRLVVEAGRDAGQSLLLDVASGERPLIGTSPSCALRLHDPHVSRRHLLLEPSSDGLLLRDVGSTNGTTIHGVRIREAIVDMGARVVIGETTLRVEAATEAVAALPEADAFGRMVGASRAMRRLFAIGERLAATNAPVLVEGETGTGKTLFCESLHEAGPRADQPFLVFDASAVPSNRVAPMIFGDTRGVGLLREAEGGTLLIQELTTIPTDVQRRLLHLIERGEVMMHDGLRAANVRLMFSSRPDVDAAVEDGRVREDLFQKLVVSRVALPPLSQRAHDTDVMARLFWTKSGGAGEIPQALLERYAGYSWPGNVRELESTVAKHAAVGLIDEAPIVPSEASGMALIDQLLERDLPIAQAREELVLLFERRYVDRVLKRYGNVRAAAAASGLALRYFRTLKAKYGYGAK